MWKDTNNGSVKQFETRQKEVVTVEIKKKKALQSLYVQIMNRSLQECVITR